MAAASASASKPGSTSVAATRIWNCNPQQRRSYVLKRTMHWLAFSVSARSEEKQHVNWQSHEQKGRASTKEGLALVSLGARGPGAQTADAWNANGWSGALAELIRLSLQMSSGIQLHGLSRKSYKDSKGHHVERDAVSAPHHYMPGFLSVSLPLMSRLFVSFVPPSP